MLDEHVSLVSLALMLSLKMILFLQNSNSSSFESSILQPTFSLQDWLNS